MIVGMLGAACGGRVVSPQIVPTPPPDVGKWVPVRFFAWKVGLNEPDTYYGWWVHIYQDGWLVGMAYTQDELLEMPLEMGQTYEAELHVKTPLHLKFESSYEFRVESAGQQVILLGGI